MKDEIKNMLGNVLGEELGDEIFDANFPDPIEGYLPGDVLTFKQLKEMPEGTIVHILYTEDDDVRTDDFYPLHKGSDDEWGAGPCPFPIDELEDDTLIRKIDNCDHFFTIRAAVPAAKGAFEKLRAGQREIEDILMAMLDLHQELHGADKERQSEIRKELKELDKKYKKTQ